MRRLQIGELDWDKTKRILWFFALGWVVTLLIVLVWRGAFFGAGQNFFRDAFVAWCGELVFFTLIGLAATVISLERPEDPRAKAFDERVNIMFGHQQVPQAVLEYNRKSLQKNARYSSNALRKIFIKYYKAEYNAYYVIVHNHYSLKSAIADFEQTETIPMEIVPDPIANLESDEVGRVTGIKINNNQKVTGYTPILKNGFKTEFEETLPSGGAVDIAMEYEIYMVCGLEQSQIANRFVESVTVEIVNQCAEDVTVTFAEKPDTPVTLLSNQPYNVKKTSIIPGGVIISFNLNAPRAKQVAVRPENAGTAAAPVLHATPVLVPPASG